MSGHSKWSKIKRTKGLKDVQKGNVFSKLSRIVTLAVIEGGGVTDPENNIKLRMAIDKARASNMPKENISRAIEKGTGPNKSLLREVVYEGFAPHGIALMIQTTTDNPTRTFSEVRNMMERHNGKIGSQGSVAHYFKKCGIATFVKDKNPETDVFQFAQNINAFDIDDDDDVFTVYFPFENLGKVKNYLSGLNPEATEIDYKPLAYISVTDEETLKKIMGLIEALEELEDVHGVFANFQTDIH